MDLKKKESLTEIVDRVGERFGTRVELTGTYRHGDSQEVLRFRFENGLRLVMMPNDRAPIFTYQSWFRVGSKDEDPEKTGIAHLFEHLMFKGTTTYPTGHFDREMERRGCQTNAATWVDWTYYTQSLAMRDDHLKTVIEFESDRMTNLVLDAPTFASELEVVKNERRVAVEDSVGGTLNEMLYALAFQEHPYRWPTIGSMAHLESVSLEDLKAFYERYYAPNNAVVVIVGDIDPAETLALVVEHYAKIPPQTIRRPKCIPEKRQEQSQKRIIERPIAAPQMVVAFRSPNQKDPDFVALELLNDALVEGETGRLYQRLVVKDELALDVDGYVAPFAEPGLYELFINIRRDVDPDRVIAAIQEELDRLKVGITAEEFDKARHNAELSLCETLEDVESMAESLGHFETNFSDFTLAFKGLEELAALDASTLGETAKTIFDPSQRTIVIANPVNTGDA